MDLAVEHLERAVDLDRDNQQAIRYLSEAYELAGRDGDAVALYRRAAQKRPEQWWVHFGLGRLFLETHRPDDAIIELKRATDLNPEFPHAWQLLRRAYSEAGRRSEAIELFRGELAKRPTDRWLVVSLGTLLIDEGNLDEAIARLEALRRRSPGEGDEAGASQHDGDALEDAGPADAATTRLLGRAFTAKARQALERGASREVLEIYRRAVAAGAVDWGMRHVLMDAYLAAGEQDGASELLATTVSALEEELKEHPDNRVALWNLSDIYVVRGQMEKAIQFDLQATKFHPEDARGFLRLGELYETQGQVDKAAAAYRQAIMKDPKRESAYLMLGRVLKSQGKIDQAVDNYEAAVARLPGSSWCHLELGRIYLEMAEGGS